MTPSATPLKTLVPRGALTLAALLACSCLAEVDTGRQRPGEPANATGAFGVAAAIIAPGVEVAAVTYVVTGNGVSPLTGSIPLDQPGATISTQIGGLPAGTYTVTLSATSVSGSIVCTGSASFDVVLGQTTPVDLALICSSANSGGTISVGLESSVSHCPNLNAGPAAPFELMVGESMLLDVAANDVDTAGLAFSWYASSGTVTTPDQPSTTFACTAPGAALLTLTVSDGSCLDSEQFAIDCIDPGA